MLQQQRPKHSMQPPNPAYPDTQEKKKKSDKKKKKRSRGSLHTRRDT